MTKRNGKPKDITTLADLTHDPKNARRHTPRNVGMIEAALGEVGAARSIVIDENGVVLAGNATIDAAARAGIERVQVVDGDGETIIAVRRSGLTAAQKARLALYDNRAAELAEWDAEVIADLAAEDDALLAGLFERDEFAEIMGALPSDDQWNATLGALPDGEKPPFQQMTFTVHDSQAETVRDALRAAILAGHGKSDVNENSNGNALALICAGYLQNGNG